MAARIMGLYRTAMANFEITKACMWRWKLVSYLADRDGTECALCRKPIDMTLPSGPRGGEDGPTIDHVHPWSKGGTDDLDNLQLAHWRCNREKGNRVEEAAA